MVEFGEELILDSLRIPWLIWIQLIVLLLLFILLYSFSLLSSHSDLSSADGPLCSSPSPSSLHGNRPQKLQSQVGEISVATGILSGRTRRRVNGDGDHHREDRARGANDNNGNREGGSSALMKERSISTQGVYNNIHHPCNIVRLAKVAFLKCFGLDSNSTASVSESKASTVTEHANER